MCTAVSLSTKAHYFGRTLDLECSYRENVVVTPRRFPLPFRRMPAMPSHYALIGMATVADGYPLYYDATNEAGLSMAGLNFPGNAVYGPESGDRDNIAPFEFIPWVLGRCKSVAEARALLERLCLADISFSPQLPLAPLHWLIADRDESITVEPVAEGLRVHDNPVGVLTNNPPFDYQMTNLSNYMALSPRTPENRFAPSLSLRPYSRGMGGLGLPGDLSSVSRFVRAAFARAHSVCGGSETESVGQFFHILAGVAHTRGCVLVDGQYEITLYTSCCSTDRGIYYYTTYGNSQITGVDMHREDLDGRALIAYPLIDEQQIRMQN